MSQFVLHTSDLTDFAEKLTVGDRVMLSGTVYTARDAAHKRIKLLIENNDKLPFDLKNAVIYYAGPTPTPENLSIGSCGPTTSSRMDKFSPEFLDAGGGGYLQVRSVRLWSIWRVRSVHPNHLAARRILNGPFSPRPDCP